MKRSILTFALALLLAWACGAQAEVIVPSGAQGETLKLGSEITIEDVCSFTVKAVKGYDVFMNQQSGTAKQFLVVSFDIINWMTEPLYLKTQMAAKLVYDESFEFEADYLWANPEGTYLYSKDNETRTYVTDVDELGNILAYYSGTSSMTSGGGLEQPYVKWINTYYYNPIDTTFVHSDDRYYTSLDPSKTVFDPLVERTMHYVFIVPDLVAEDEGLRVLTLSIEGYEYELRF